MEQALEESNRAGIATFVMRGREYLVALKAEKDLLALHTLHWADEIRDPRKEIPDLPKASKASAGELKMAQQLINALAVDWDPADYHDAYRQKVSALIKAKKAGETVAKAEPAPAATGTVDLMEALRASLRRAGSPKGGGGKAGSSTAGSGEADGSAAGGSKARAGGAARRPAAKKRAASGTKPLRSLTKTQLYDKATEAGIRGRSHMSHDELADALAHQR